MKVKKKGGHVTMISWRGRLTSKCLMAYFEAGRQLPIYPLFLPKKVLNHDVINRNKFIR